MTRIETFAQLAKRLLLDRSDSSTLLLGVDGVAGAGKSTFAANLAAAMQELECTPTLVRLDDYFYRTSGRRPIYFRNGDADLAENDYDYEWSRFRDEVLLPLRNGQSARLGKCDNENGKGDRPKCLAAGGVVIFEGVTSIRKELAPHYDFRVFVQAPRKVCTDRTDVRDGEAMSDWYRIYWRPEEDHYIQAHDPAAVADLVVDSATHHEFDRQLAYARME